MPCSVHMIVIQPIAYACATLDISKAMLTHKNAYTWIWLYRLSDTV